MLLTRALVCLLAAVQVRAITVYTDGKDHVTVGYLAIIQEFSLHQRSTTHTSLGVSAKACLLQWLQHCCADIYG